MSDALMHTTEQQRSDDVAKRSTLARWIQPHASTRQRLAIEGAVARTPCHHDPEQFALAYREALLPFLGLLAVDGAEDLIHIIAQLRSELFPEQRSAGVVWGGVSARERRQDEYGCYDPIF